MEMRLQVVTVSVKSLDRARGFYEGVLGFEPDIFYEPTRWQSYRIEGEGGFGIVEQEALDRSPTSDIVNLTVSDVEGLWARVKDAVDVESELGTTPWGTFRFVIRDPDGFRLGFVGPQT